MLKFSTYKTVDGLNHYAKNKDFELEFIISKDSLTPFTDQKWQLREYLYGAFEEFKYFSKLADAKKWANTQNSYLDGI